MKKPGRQEMIEIIKTNSPEESADKILKIIEGNCLHIEKQYIQSMFGGYYWCSECSKKVN